MDTVTPEDRELRALLGEARTIAVVGLSSKEGRASFGVARYLQTHGFRIVPVNPRETEVLGEPAYPTLLDIPCDVTIDVVDVFRRARRRRPRSPATPSRSAPRSCGCRRGSSTRRRTASPMRRASR